MDETKFTYLNAVNSPDDLKKLSSKELKPYCQELRQFIIEQVAENPGHLGSSLGVLELTVALHYVFDTPNDKLVWDVGHQAYPHKIITSRRDVFDTNRKMGGISGFPKRTESQYDAFGGGHSSVSISAALGIAKASELKGEKRNVVAIIGDGAMTGGLAFEGLNNAGASNSDILVILNDNHMSIDPNVGALKEYFLSITTSKKYNNLKIKVWNGLSTWPHLRRAIQKTNTAIKQGLLQQSNIFESFRFRYFGPMDGHDIDALTKVLRDLKDIPGPKLLHILTVKGKGYEPAENNQSVWHAPGKFNAETGELLSKSKGKKPRYQDVFGNTILELARQNDKIVGITPAMPSGCSLNIMMEHMPKRCFDVGIAEGHAVTFSAGLAATGLTPFCNIYSSFMQRAYDNVIHDVAIQNLGVVFCLDRAGVVGEDGPTHHGVFDIAYFRCVPNMVISSPINETELRNLMYTAQRSNVPFVIRYPRGEGMGSPIDGEFELLPIGKSKVLREGKEVAVLSFGHVGNFATEAIDRAVAEGVDAAHVDIRYIKPLDQDMMHWVCRNFSRIITVEDGVIAGGVGSAVLEFIASNGYSCRVDMLGVPDNFIEHGSLKELHNLCGYDADGIFSALLK